MVGGLEKVLQAAGIGLALLFAQTPSTEEGFLIPTRDTIYILVVFAEVDYTLCGADPHEQQYGQVWGKDEHGHTKVPADADSLLDPSLPPGTAPRGLITRTYVEASFGHLVILGDYLPAVVSVPCHRLPSGGTFSLQQEIELISEALQGQPFSTAHGVSWQAFDRWVLLPQRAGLPKRRTPSQPDPTYRPRLDILFVIWRNLAYRLDIQKPPLPCNYGFGLWTCNTSMPIGPFTGGVETASSYTTCGTAKGAATGFLAEFFHGLYGGNHWHTAGGAGFHTFPFLSICRGLSTQGGRPIYAIGYDRWVMGWKAPNKAYLISAVDEEGREVSTDLRQPSRPETLRVWLRDFLTTGDAIRIRLPYTEKGGPMVKNQYLWLENRRFISSSEVWGSEALTNCTSKPPSPLRGFPGVYAYIQVGKDKKEGTDIYSADFSHPNGLGSWIFWLPAEGRYDFIVRETPKGWAIDKSASLPNPFLGMHDFYLAMDIDGDGVIRSGQEWKGYGILEWRGDSVCASWYSMGDEWDAFSPRRLLSIGTNPAPTPVYTLRSEEGYRLPAPMRPATYDNRIIWLSGLCIEIEEERSDGAILLQIRWNETRVRNATRWCGDIRLLPHPYDSSAPALHLLGKVILDRSLSPIYSHSREYDTLTKRYWFSDTTQLVIESGSRMHIERQARLILRRGSRLIIKPGAIVEGKGQIEIEPGSTLICHPEGLCKVRVRYRRKPYRLFLE
ncbi:MAG: hypothetical protein RMK19_07105 [Bacteroidia bacterium]|nr:hypothetical protein [Bacteroidia bacterium]MDW8015764.1 hypothetical protein [Bacteroidia bacterium]